jgi:hypothetical protein
MPQLSKVLTEEDIKTQRVAPTLDLTPYLAIIDSVVKDGVGGVLALAEGESKRTEKRRMSLAAKERNLNLTWRKSDEGVLKFVLAKVGHPVPGGRQRKK